MYAIFETGGKQYRAQEGEVIHVEKLNAEPGETLEIEQILAIGGNGEFKVGTPIVDGAKVVVKVLTQDKAKKVIVFKYKPKKGYRRKLGHRQPFTKIVVEKIIG